LLSTLFLLRTEPRVDYIPGMGKSAQPGTEDCRCDLCGSDASLPLPRYITRPHRVVICQGCGLIYSNPRLSRAFVEEFYANTFQSDPGALKRGSVDVTQSNLDKRVAGMRPFVESLLDHLGDPKGKRWLEVRCRSGSVAEILGEHGVEVHGVDPFEANVAFARERFGAERFHESSIYDLVGPAPGEFDAIGMLTVHVLAHSPAPSRLLKDCYDRLKVGGLIFVSDKDVTQPHPGLTEFALSGNGAVAHFQQMTLNSLRGFVRKAGFEIERAEHLDRWSGLRHLIVVGRKPQVPLDAVEIKADDPRLLHDQLVSLYRRHVVRAPVRMIQRRIGKKRIKMVKSKIRLARHRTLKWFNRRRA
jgi:SAM-dependent methyltransferase